MKTEFKEYKLLHNFMHPNEPLKGWISEDNFTNHYLDDWNVIMSVVERCKEIGYSDTDFGDDVYQKWEELFGDDLTGAFLGNHISEVYAACVDFIDWHNDYEPETPSRDDVYEDYSEVHGSTSKNRRS